MQWEDLVLSIFIMQNNEDNDYNNILTHLELLLQEKMVLVLLVWELMVLVLLGEVWKVWV